MIADLKKPQLIEAGVSIDDRGKLMFANGFDFHDVKRFYMVSNHKGIYNLHKNNVKIVDLAKEVKEQFKDIKVEKVDMQFQDSRNYRVSSDKASQAFGFAPQFTSADGIAELKKVLEEGRIKDCNNPLYINQAYLSKSGSHNQYPEKGWI